MVFLSAQPDEVYFIWQIEVQLQNFKRLGIDGNQIHILFGIKQDVSKALETFIAGNTYGKIFLYTDNRLKTRYASGIRPHIIKKHYEQFQHLVNTPVFYHDSDIIFRELPIFSSLIEGNTWYVSDTRSYIAAKHIKKSDTNILDKMCAVVGIARTEVEKNDSDAGGAQYLLKNVNHQFWEKVEFDAEELFVLLQNEQTDGPLQAWCSDMWALLWNAWLYKHPVKIHSELDFCWPFQTLSFWNSTKIFHNAGVKMQQMEQVFCKGAFKHSKPFGLTIGSFDRSVCGIKYFEEIEAFTSQQFKDTVEISHVEMKANYLKNYLKRLADQLISLAFDNEMAISQNDLLSISVILYNYGAFASSKAHQQEAEKILELAAIKPLSYNYTLNDGATAFGITLEHLHKFNFIADDVNDILFDVDEVCLGYIKKITKIEVGNYNQVLSILHYALVRNADLLDESLSQKFIQLFSDFHHHNYRGFLDQGKIDLLEKELSAINVLTVLLQRHSDRDLKLLIEQLTDGILHYLFVLQNEVKLYNAKILTTLLKSNLVLKNDAFREKIQIALHHYLQFILHKRNEIIYPEQADIDGGIGGVLFDHVVLVDLLGNHEILETFMRELCERIKMFIIHHQEYKGNQQNNSITFINGVSGLGIALMGAFNPGSLLNFNDFYMR